MTAGTGSAQERRELAPLPHREVAVPTARGQAQVPIRPSGSAVVLRGLDKVTAHITTFDVPIGETVAFGTLGIVARTCHKRPPEEPPEVSAFLQIAENRPGAAEPVQIFSGWMFASSPALSALEHPVYDVWVLDCRMPSNSGTDGSDPPR